MTPASYQAAIAKASEKDYEGAIALFNQTLQDQPDFADAYYQRGSAQFKLGYFQAAPPIRPLIDLHEFLRQAEQKAKQKNYQGAMEDLNWALEIDPLDAWAYASRGQVKANFGNLRGAIEDCQQAAVLFSQRANPKMAKQMQQTVQTLQTALQTAAKRTWAYEVMSVERMVCPDIEVGTPSRTVQKKLLRLVGDDRKIAAGLVKHLKLKHPGRPEDWYWEKAIYDLERDRS
mgnify:CR=1 FL=1